MNYLERDQEVNCTALNFNMSFSVETSSNRKESDSCHDNPLTNIPD